MRLLRAVLTGLCFWVGVAGCADGDNATPPSSEGGSAGSIASQAGAAQSGGSSGSGVGDAGAAGSGDGAAGQAETPSGGRPSPSGGAAGSGDEAATAGSGGGSAGQGEGPIGCGTLDLDALAQGTWDPRFTIAGVTGHDGITPMVYDFAVDRDGSVLAAGRFAYYEDQAVAPLLRWRDGQWQNIREEWSFEPPGSGFSAIALNDAGTLALATGDSFGERNGEIWLGENGALTAIASFTGQVRTLAWFAGKLYAAGVFALSPELGGVANLAVWDGADWSEPMGGAADGAVLELLVSDDVLYVAGAFGEIGGVVTTNVASFDGSAWTALSFADSLSVYALARTDAGELYAGGVLGELDAPSGLARRVGDAWEIVGGGLAQFGTRGVVSDLAAHDGVVDVTGCFNTAGGAPDAESSVPAQGLARWDGEQWQSLNTGSGTLSPWFQPTVCGDESVHALWDVEYQRLAFSDGKLFAGGSFAGVEGVQTQSLAVREDGSWVAQGTAGLGLGGSLDRVASGGPSCSVYGLGSFTHLGGEQRPGRVARFSGSAWEALGDSLPTDAYCPALDVSPEGQLAVACMIFPEGGADARGIILSPQGGDLVPLELNRELPPIMAVKWDAAGKLWVAGGGATGFVASVEGTRVTVLSDAFDGAVQFVDVSDPGAVFIAGMFEHVGELEARRVAHYVGGEWRALGEGVFGQPQALARDADGVYVSTFNEGSGAYLLGHFDGTTWRELAGSDAGLLVEDFYSFNQILPAQGGLLLVGSAALEDGSGRGALLFRDGRFEPIGGGGVHGIIVSGVAATPRALWFGGVIAEASSGSKLTSSVGVARLRW